MSPKSERNKRKRQRRKQRAMAAQSKKVSSKKKTSQRKRSSGKKQSVKFQVQSQNVSLGGKEGSPAYRVAKAIALPSTANFLRLPMATPGFTLSNKVEQYAMLTTAQGLFSDPQFLVGQGATLSWSSATALPTSMVVLCSSQPSRPLFVLTKFQNSAVFFVAFSPGHSGVVASNCCYLGTGNGPLTERTVNNSLLYSVASATMPKTYTWDVGTYLPVVGVSEAMNFTGNPDTVINTYAGGSAGGIHIAVSDSGKSYFWLSAGQTVTVEILPTRKKTNNVDTKMSNCFAAVKDANLCLLSVKILLVAASGQPGDPDRPVPTSYYAQASDDLVLTISGPLSSTFLSTTYTMLASGYFTMVVQSVTFDLSATGNYNNANDQIGFIGDVSIRVWITQVGGMLGWKAYSPPDLRAMSNLSERMRPTAASFLFSDFTSVNSMGGAISACEVRDSSLNSVIDVVVQTGANNNLGTNGNIFPATTGLYTWMRPVSGPLLPFSNEYDFPIYRLDASYGQKLLVFSNNASMGGDQTFRVVITLLCEFQSDTQLFGSPSLCDVSTQQFEEALKLLLHFPPFMENPSHLETFLAAIKKGGMSMLKGIRKAIPYAAKVAAISGNPVIAAALTTADNALHTIGLNKAVKALEYHMEGLSLGLDDV